TLIALHSFPTRRSSDLWFAQRSNIDLDLFDVKFVDGVNGWVVGNEGTVLHTTNGGAHWALERTATNHALDRLFFVDPNHGWAVRSEEHTSELQSRSDLV